MSNPLTGRSRYRLGWFGKLVLQVEYATLQPHDAGARTDWKWTGRAWRDARCEDLVCEQRDDLVVGGRTSPTYQPHPLPPVRCPREPSKDQ